MNNKRQGRR